MKRLLFIAIVYNAVEVTIDLCNSLARQTPGDYQITLVLVDNSDTEAARSGVDALAAEFAFAEVLRPERNLGYFPAISLALGHYAKDYDYVIAGNNDLVYADDFCTTLVEQCYENDVMVVCPDVVTLDGVHQNPHVLKPRTGLQRIKLDLYFSNYYIAYALRIFHRLIQPLLKSKKRDKPSQPSYLHMGIGACYVLLPAFLSRFMQLDFPHFLYGEEAYLTRQVHFAGGRLFYDPELKVLHEESATLSKLPKRTTYEFGRDSYWSNRTFY